jgi:hypothetical protein
MKTIIKAALLAPSLLATPTFANPIPAADRAALSERIAAFDAAFRSGNISVLSDFLPIKIRSGQSVTTEDTVNPATQEQVNLGPTTVTAVAPSTDYDEYHLDLTAAIWQMTPDGSRGYALIPTHTEFTLMSAGRMRFDSNTLAFAENGTWFLMRVDDPAQVQLLTAAYPEFTGVTFQPDSITAVE